MLKLREKEEVKILTYNILVVEDDIDIIKLLKLYILLHSPFFSPYYLII